MSGDDFCVTEELAWCCAAIATELGARGGGWVLDGRKQFITNGGIADLPIVRVDGERGLGAFIVERDTPGLSLGRKERKMGVRGSHTAEVILKHCRVPDANRLAGTPSAPQLQS